ncbi:MULTISPECIES: pyridoxamine 5'-phosphate oxidase family protein [Rhodococcus]|uniref:Pyridoxamine 5'-phosphate oxidase family protein n=1 Tax=Rhodococcus erythropolis TaxID=1833 RepID=A0A8I1A3C6_RHOER|nr:MULTISPECIES: pyridoxamine 5'-phosphate oxidase family protein [Rhodococcus]MBH5146366.1 pyridoxamine 5'-phosphate oxidase family protein [Rhodococcus erythropolis]QXC46852.1 pyridoxamine 5'-phosphate oxidase family protein [Rhodococcus qingshengii]
MTADDLSPHVPVEILDNHQCWVFLAQQQLGRLVTGSGERADIFPVNYVVDDHHLYFRTAEGTKLVELTVNDRVLFEADHIDTTNGWSVVVRGTARALTSFTEMARIDELGLRSWIPTPKYNIVEITATEITGRAVHFDPEN